jgi:hypothetical protein
MEWTMLQSLQGISQDVVGVAWLMQHNMIGIAATV